MRLITLLSTLICSFALHAVGPEDIRSAIGREYACAEPSADAYTLMSAMDADGAWADIDYADTSRSLWQLERHLDRLVDMSLAFRRAGASDTAMLAAIDRGLRNWFDNGYTNTNWWYGKIGVPRRMLAIAWLVDDKLSPCLHDRIDGSLDAIDSDDYPARPGGDRIQVLSNHAKVLLWRRDFKGVDKIYDKIESEARIAPYEDMMFDAAGGPAVRNDWRPSGRGVQSDMTFHHRGDRVNSTLTYGLELPEYFAYWASLLRGSERPFSRESVNFIIDYYLDGVTRHLVAGRYVEPSILNRELARPGAGEFSSHIAKRLLAIADGYRADELQQSVDAIEGKAVPASSYAAYFPQSDYFAFSRPGFHTAVRFYSERNANQEAPHNSEGIRNHFRGDGANMLSVTGREYADIVPVFDFRMIPGATTPLIPYNPLSAWGDVVVLNSPVRFAGAVTDSVYGAVTFDFISGRSDLRARKAWFFFDDEYLCLGSGISSCGADTVVTTVEQCLSPSDFTSDGRWYFHAGNAYHVIDGVAEAARGHRRGTWANCVRDVAYAGDAVEADVFSLAINHGVGPEGGSYAYAVVPGASTSREHKFSILANTPAVQAVRSADKNLTYMVFYEAGRLDTPFGAFAVSQPCIMMLHGDMLYLSDPSRRHASLAVATPYGHYDVGLPSDFGGTTVRIKMNGNL